MTKDLDGMFAPLVDVIMREVKLHPDTGLDPSDGDISN